MRSRLVYRGGVAMSTLLRASARGTTDFRYDALDRLTTFTPPVGIASQTVAAWLLIIGVGTSLVALNPRPDIVCFHSSECGYRGIEHRSGSPVLH